MNTQKIIGSHLKEVVILPPSTSLNKVHHQMNHNSSSPAGIQGCFHRVFPRFSTGSWGRPTGDPPVVPEIPEASEHVTSAAPRQGDGSDTRDTPPVVRIQGIPRGSPKRDGQRFKRPEKVGKNVGKYVGTYMWNYMWTLSWVMKQMQKIDGTFRNTWGLDLIKLLFLKFDNEHMSIQRIMSRPSIHSPLLLFHFRSNAWWLKSPRFSQTIKQ